MNKHRYHSLSISLHWLIAMGLVFMFVSGLYMVNAEIPKAEQYKLFQIHKASGVVMLWAILLRLLVRIFTQKPPLPNVISKEEAKRAKLGHVLLYTGLAIMPLSGWVMVSASPFGLPTLVFVDWLNWPHIPGIQRNKLVEGIANNIHMYTAILLSCLIVGHIAAVYWHKRTHNINLVKRMWWSNNDN